MDENNVKLLIFCRGKEQLKTRIRKTWSRSKNSRLPVSVNVTVYLSMISLGLWDRLCHTGRFATTILSSTQCCNVGTVFQPFETISQPYNVATLCCAKNRRCESSRVTSSLRLAGAIVVAYAP